MNKKKIIGFILVLSVIIIVLFSGYMLVFGSISPKTYSGVFMRNWSEVNGDIC